MNQNWSDDESSEDEVELNQPNRDFPISDDEEEEEEEYDMYELTKLTVNKNMTDDLFKKEEPVFKETSKETSKPKLHINNELKIEKNIIKSKRKFNPRLPPPNKYNKSNNNLNIKLNLNDFPSLSK